MAPRNGVKPQATAKRKRLQEKLREGCKLGDLSEVSLPWTTASLLVVLLMLANSNYIQC